MFTCFVTKLPVVFFSVFMCVGCSAPTNSDDKSTNNADLRPEIAEPRQEIIVAALNAYVSQYDSDKEMPYLVSQTTTDFSNYYKEIEDFLSGWGKGYVSHDVESAIRDFIKVDVAPVRIPAKPPLSFMFRQIGPDELARLLADRESIGWAPKSSDSGTTNGILQISQPVIDSTGRFAIAYVVWTGDYDVARASLLVLTKENGSWELHDQIPMWVA